MAALHIRVCLSFMFFTLHFAKGDLEPTLQHCCQLGTVIGAQNQKCDEATSGTPVQGIPAEQQSICLSTMQLCCARTLRDIQCKEGKLAATRGNSCHFSKHEDSKYCCEACKLGMISGSMAMGCEFREFSLSEMWDETYQTCCTSISTPDKLSPVPLPTSNIPPSFPPVLPSPPQPTAASTRSQKKPQSNENICDFLKGELCAHICVPEAGGSYHCECERDFTLMADGKSCQQAKLFNRCEVNNPCQQKCTDTGIAIECSCLNGFQLNPDNKTCSDVDECELEIHDCLRDQICRNELGTFSCHERQTSFTAQDQRSSTNSGFESVPDSRSNRNNTNQFKGDDRCPFGYVFNYDTQLCQDVDECEADLHVCGVGETCVNMPGGYRCTQKQTTPQQSGNCQLGFSYSAQRNSCIDINECEGGENPCESSQTCENTVGSFTCQCRPGYQLDPLTQACLDIDECKAELYVCNSGENCVNLPGGYRCARKPPTLTSLSPMTCQSGFRYSSNHKNCIDVDECAEEESPCDSNQVCENAVGSYLCKCKSGFQLDSLTQACVDINECQVDLHNCLSETQRCDNTIGSFQCVRYANCGTGYTLNAQTNLCEDNDECALGMCDHLGPGYKCRNTLGFFRCDKIHNTTTTTTTTTPRLPPLFSSSSSSPGYHVTVRCPRGYALSHDNRCIDVNECERRDICKPDQVCINIQGGYICSNKLNCEPGFRLNEETNQCADIDECVEQPGLCDHTCYNTWGSFRCTCRPGFTLFQDNRTCVDINECEVFKDRRLCIGYCVNQPGSYSCQCPQGYRLGIDGASCQDIDECSNQNPCTGRNEVCLNMRGTYRCVSTACPPDYIKDSQHKNRCKRITTSCREGDTECLQKPLTYTFHFITLVSNLTRPGTSLDLFTMRGPLWSSTKVEFQLLLDKVHTPRNVQPATLESFELKQTDHNVANIGLLQPLLGPQEIFLQLVMKFYYNGIYGGTTVSNIAIFVSQYEF